VVMLARGANNNSVYNTSAGRRNGVSLQGYKVEPVGEPYVTFSPVYNGRVEVLVKRYQFVNVTSSTSESFIYSYSFRDPAALSAYIPCRICSPIFDTMSGRM
jgi:hypothetical protein